MLAEPGPTTSTPTPPAASSSPPSSEPRTQHSSEPRTQHLSEPRTQHSSEPRTQRSGVGGSPPPAPRQRYRLRFRKDGDLRLVSHHDLMHCFERMLRRAALPVAQTQGFHPQPRMAFALSLALGIVGLREVVEIEFTEELPAEELKRRLDAQVPPGLTITSVSRLAGKISAQVRRAFYSLAVPDSFLAEGVNLSERCAELLARERLWIFRTRPRPRKLDIRPYLERLSYAAGRLDLALWVTPNGTARPEEVVHLLELDRVLDQGGYFERTDLELVDEAGAPPPCVVPVAEQDVGLVAEAVELEGKSSRPTALVSGPLSFES